MPELSSPEVSQKQSDLVFKTAREQARLIADGEISSVELVGAHLEQIGKVNPVVNAMVTMVAESAMEQAGLADKARSTGEELGPLHGLPIAIKDLQDTAGILTTHGSPIYKDNVPARDALIVERVKNAGAIIVGKSNTPEFGAGSQTFNPVFGATRNPYDTTRTCGGSSGGAGVALACGMVPIATGSDHGGSLRNPAAWSNVVGIRASQGRVPAINGDLGWSTPSTDGPMGRTVGDVALQLSVMAGHDSRSPMSIQESGDMFAGANSLERDFRGVRIAWSKDLGGRPMDAENSRVTESQRHVFEHLGCIVDDDEPDLSSTDEIFQAKRAYYFAIKHEIHLRDHRQLVKETIIWNTEQGLKMPAIELAHAERLRTRLWEQLMVFFDKYEFLALPVTSVPPFSIEEEYVTEINGVQLETYLDWMWPCYTISATGLPAISVPAGFTNDGLPVGLQLVGRPRDEMGLLQLAHAFEQETNFWKQRPGVVG
ncbi:MAG: amidase [Chloroflexi bacterium]|nr:amidase [Chloroflexota bacterium]MCI0803231.1 amidase [Chloroflexota bacterium]MCI0833789.1 amidase [Chloroflexota bacterium]MCI0851776.1 amidase [Chloroflexota bacterium]MCI0871817.1 amidase [Chloroflexota bacterium]